MTEQQWDIVRLGMAAARTVPDVGCQATSDEAAACGGPDFLAESALTPEQFLWHVGYDHAILLARRQ